MEYDLGQHSPSSSSTSSSSSRLSPSSWIRTKALDLPEDIKEKCASFFSKIGGKARRRTSNTSEFRYDPTSYALNFDDEAARFDEFPLNSFSARLPSSPQLKPRSEKRFPAAVSREIAAFS